MSTLFSSKVNVWLRDVLESQLRSAKGERGRLVESALARDDAVMNTRDDWAAKIKRRRHIDDFSNWKDKPSYQKAFARFLRDLKATIG